MPETEELLPWERAVARLRYRLAFTSTDRRTFRPDELCGPDIPDALDEQRMSPGAWFQDFGPDPSDVTVSEAEWLAHFFSMVLNEGVHEILEWYQIEGRRYLNPHGVHAAQIHEHVNALAAALTALADSSAEEPG